MTDVDANEVNKNDRIYVALGFPEKLSSTSDFGTHISLKPITSTGAGRPAVLQSLKLGLDAHIAVEFDRLNSLKDGKRETVPMPNGMSGGPLFRLDPTGRRDKLVGVLIKHPIGKNAVVATHIGVCLTGVTALHPELADRIPERWHADPNNVH